MMRAQAPSTYLHARYGQGWPADQNAEDAFDLPPKLNAQPEGSDPEFKTWAPADPEAAKVDLGMTEDAVGELFFQRSLNDPDDIEREYSAEFTSKGGAVLLLTTITRSYRAKTIASFDTMADAQTAAEALNNHEGY